MIIQVTGLEEGNRTSDLIYQTFTKLKKESSFDTSVTAAEAPSSDEENRQLIPNLGHEKPLRELRIGYTINLNLPATANIEVFDAIFQSLRKNLLTDE